MIVELTGTFLPLGSILRLEGTENDDLFYMILARAIMENEVGEIVPRYKVVAHPKGIVPEQEVFAINVTEITEVIFEGYSDGSDQEFIDSLLDMVKNGHNSATSIAVSDTEESFEPDETETFEANEVDEVDEKERLKVDPFYKFRK